MQSAIPADLKHKLPCFLHLPFEIRRRTYILAGLVRVCPINLNNEGAAKVDYLQECKDWCFDTLSPAPHGFHVQAGWRCYYRHKRFMDNAINPSQDGFDCMCEPLPYNLLLVSKAVRNEVVSILYSENMFKVCRSDRQGISPLLSLNAIALGSMSSLCIRLNACSCIPGHQCPEQMNTDKDCPLCHHNCKIGRDQPISKFTVEGQAIIREWGVLVRRLKTNIKAHQLNLSVICDTLDYQTAEDIVGPLLELPLLTDCAVRLGQASSHVLQRLAENTVLRLTGRPTHHLENSFGFLDLPREIQWQILGHTDLVAPRPIEWVSGHGIVLPDCCRKCTDNLESCCCSLLHAAFTSAQCTCWRLPTAIFQVSKGIHECATRLFFSKNKFKLPTLDWSLDGGDHSCVLRFLAALPRHSLQHIRSLHCVFSSLEDHHLDPDSQAWANWHATAAFMSRHLSLPDLTLTIEDTTSRGGPSVFNLTTGIDDSAETRRAERKLHQRIAEPLAQLQGLRDLFLHFSVGGYGKFETPGEQEETVLEKRIMGEAYDSRAHGKYAEEVQRREDIKRAERPVFGPDGAQIWPLY